MCPCDYFIDMTLSHKEWSESCTSLLPQHLRNKECFFFNEEEGKEVETDYSCSGEVIKMSPFIMLHSVWGSTHTVSHSSLNGTFLSTGRQPKQSSPKHRGSIALCCKHTLPHAHGCTHKATACRKHTHVYANRHTCNIHCYILPVHSNIADDTMLATQIFCTYSSQMCTYICSLLRKRTSDDFFSPASTATRMHLLLLHLSNLSLH